MLKKVLFIALLFFLSLSGVFAQECYEYHKAACKPAKSKYAYDQTRNSVSFLFKAGESREVPVDLYAGKDYRITICSSEVFDDVISFSVLRQDGTIIYSNANDNYALNLEFSSKKTQQLTILLEIPETNSGLEVKGCVGVLIEDMVSVKTGF